MVINSQDQMLDQQRSLALALSQEVARLQAENTDIADSMIEFLKEVPKLKEPAGADDIHLEALAAMDESMSSIQQLSTMARLHKEELASWQSELDAMHQRLADGSSDVLKAQVVGSELAAFTKWVSDNLLDLFPTSFEQLLRMLP